LNETEFKKLRSAGLFRNLEYGRIAMIGLLLFFVFIAIAFGTTWNEAWWLTPLALIVACLSFCQFNHRELEQCRKLIREYLKSK